MFLHTRIALSCYSLTYTQIRNFLRTEVKGNRTVTFVGAPLLDTAGLSLIENCLLPVQPAQPTSSSKSAHIEVAPTDVFVVSIDLFSLPMFRIFHQTSSFAITVFSLLPENYISLLLHFYLTKQPINPAYHLVIRTVVVVLFQRPSSNIALAF